MERARPVPAQWQEDSKSAFLMASTRGRLLVLGVDPFAEVRCTGFADGDCLWDLSLRQRTGDGKIDGETFLGRLLIFFFGGAGKSSSRVRVAEKFSQDGGLQTALFLLLYIICCAVVVSLQSSGPSRKGVPRSSDTLGRRVRCFRLQQPVDLFTP